MRNEYRLSLAVPAFGPGDFRRMSCCIVRLQLHTQYCVPFRVLRAKAPFPVSSRPLSYLLKMESSKLYCVHCTNITRSDANENYILILPHIISNISFTVILEAVLPYCRRKTSQRPEHMSYTVSGSIAISYVNKLPIRVS